MVMQMAQDKMVERTGDMLVVGSESRASFGKIVYYKGIKVR